MRPGSLRGFTYVYLNEYVLKSEVTVTSEKNQNARQFETQLERGFDWYRVVFTVITKKVNSSKD